MKKKNNFDSNESSMFEIKIIIRDHFDGLILSHIEIIIK